MCTVTRALTGIATGGLSETVRAGVQVAKGDLMGGLMSGATFGLNGTKVGAAVLKSGGGAMPTMPELPNMSTNLPGAPPAATAGSSQTAQPFSLSIRPRKSQSLRTDKTSPVGQSSSGLNIPM